MRTVIFLQSLLLLAACATVPPPEPITVSGIVVQESGKYFLEGPDGRYHLNRMPQLRYSRYLGQQLIIEGTIPNQCAQVWSDALVQVHGGAELVDWSRVDWSQCVAAEKVTLVTGDGERQVYDWQEIYMRFYYF